MTEELLACFDAAANPIEPQPRSIALQQPFPDYYHAVANVWLIDKNLNMLCSKRSELVKAESGKWQTKFGGHVQAEHTFLETAIKELEEEAGLMADPSDLYLVEKGVNEAHKHFYESYMLLFNPEKHQISFNDGEVAEAKWMTLEEYNSAKAENPKLWVNGIDLDTQENLKTIFQNLL